MKQFILMVTLLITGTVVSTNTMAASTEVTWKGYKEYFDVDEGTYTRAGFKDLLTKNVGEHFTELAAKLPDEQTLKIEITDVDLAGQVRIGSTNDTRIVKNGYPPRINFSYQLLDDNETVIKKEEIVLRDLSFMTGQPLKYRHTPFGYEKKMLDDWFKGTFKDLVIK